MLVLRTLNFQGVTIRPTVPRKTPCCLYCLSRASSKLILNYFQLFQIKVVTAKCSIVCFQCSRLFTEKFLRASTIHPSIFGGRQYLIKIECFCRASNLKRKQSKPHLIQFQQFIFDMPACLPQNFHGQVLSFHQNRRKFSGEL